MGVVNNIIDQMLTDIKFIQTSNSYTNNIDFTYKGAKMLNDQNSFNMACIWYAGDEHDTDNNDNSPQTRFANINIDIHVRVTPIGEGNLDELIDSMKDDMIKWLFKSKLVTANKWNTYDVAGIAGTVWGDYFLGNIEYARLDESGIALTRFPLKVRYSPQYR